MKVIQLEISETVDKKRISRGSVPLTVPTLEDILPFVTSKQTGEEDGLPVYESDEANWVQAAIVSYVKVNARNKTEIVGGVAKVKDGSTIPSTWAEFTAEPTGRGGGAALALAREAKETFAKWAATLGKSEAATATMVTLFSNKAALQLQTQQNKAKMEAYITQFVESLDEETALKLEKPITSVMESCKAELSDF